MSDNKSTRRLYRNLGVLETVNTKYATGIQIKKVHKQNFEADFQDEYGGGKEQRANQLCD